MNGDEEEPLPLARALPRSGPFPITALGDALGAAASAFQEITQAPIDICANAALGVAALAGQAHADIVLPTGEAKPISLYIVTIARSGERKTSVDGRALVPVKEKQAALRQRYQEEIIAYTNVKAAWEAQRKKILNDKKLEFDGQKAALERLGAEPQAPLTPVLVANEPTIEGLAKLLSLGQPLHWCLLF